MTPSSGGTRACPREAPPAASSTTQRPSAEARARPLPRGDLRLSSPSTPHADYHQHQPTAQARRERRPSPPPAPRLMIGLIACLAACSSVTARLPRVAFDTGTDAAAAKMLRPAARASACRTTVLGLAIGGPPSPLDAALRALLGSDPEADQLRDVQVQERTFTSGLLNRTCITVQADVVRAISVVRLPAPGGHHGHH